MATTTNYGWTTPDDTALVKDGAAAIRTLGSSIDSTLKTQIDAQIPDSLLTTKGDLIAATGASTPARVGVGTNGQVLLADSTAAAGVAWGTPAAGSLTLLSTTSLSGASTTVSSISGSYKHLFGVIYGLNLSTLSQFNIAPNSSDSLFYGVDIRNRSASVASGQISNEYIRTNGAVTSANTNNIWTFTIYNYANTSYYKSVSMNYFYQGDAGSGAIPQGGVVSGGLQTNSAINAIQVIPSSGSMNAGTLLIYGVN